MEKFSNSIDIKFWAPLVVFSPKHNVLPTVVVGENTNNGAEIVLCAYKPIVMLEASTHRL